MKRLLQFILLAPIALIGLAFAVANRHVVAVSFDPFAGNVADMQIAAPLFVLLILALMCGVLIGGVVTWFAQSRHRRALREARSEAARWRSQCERLQATAGNNQDLFPPSRSKETGKDMRAIETRALLTQS
jgi:uncharacterized integral membrane protein